MKVLFIGFSIGLLLTGCTNDKASKLMACSAEEYLSCPQNSISVENIGANTYLINGCGKKIKVYCKGPTDGCLIYIDANSTQKTIVFPTNKCTH